MRKIYVPTLWGAIAFISTVAVAATGYQVFYAAANLEQVSDQNSSVELGILELSPRGVEGGYAMPASGCSDIHPICSWEGKSLVCTDGEHECSTPPPDDPVTGGIDMAPYFESRSPEHRSRFYDDADVAFYGIMKNEGDTRFEGDDQVDLRLVFAFDEGNCTTLTSANSVEDLSYRVDLFTGNFDPGQSKTRSRTVSMADLGLGNHCYRYRIGGSSGYTDIRTSNNKTEWRRIRVVEGPVYGCTFPDATNYDSNATYDDGSCTYPPPPDPVPAINITCPLGGPVSVSWSASSGATSYNLRIDNQSNSWVNDCSSPNSGDVCINGQTTSSYTINSPVAGTAYRAWVHACGTYGCSDSVAADVTCAVPSPADLAPNTPVGNRNITAGEALTIGGTVRNLGQSPSSALYRSHLYLQRETSPSVWAYVQPLFVNDDQAALAAGANRPYGGNFTTSQSLVTGTYRITHGVFANRSSSAYSDGNVGNNYVSSPSFTITAPAPADLTPDVPTGNQNIKAGETLTVSGTVRNIGALPTSALYRSHIYLQRWNGTAWVYVQAIDVDDDQPALAAAGSRPYGATITTSSSLPTGTYRIRHGVFANRSSSAYSDGNTGNNFASSPNFTITALTPADLAPNTPTGNQDIFAGETLSAGGTMRNLGELPTSAQYRSHIYLSRWNGSAWQWVAAFDVDEDESLGANASRPYSGNYTTPDSLTPGTYRITHGAFANRSSNVYSDANTTNNYASTPSFTVTAPPAPDLDPDNPTKTGGVNSAGTKTHTFSGVMHNRGNADSGSFSYEFQIDYNRNSSSGDVTITGSRPNVAAGGSLTVTGSQSINMPEGNHRFRLVQTPTVADDSDASNNTSGWTNFTVAPNAEVTLDAIPSLVVEGETTTLRWVVDGSNGCTASGDWSGSKSSSDGTYTQDVTINTRGEYTYGINCTAPSPGASASDTTTLTVLGPVCTTPQSLEGDRDLIRSGESVELTFSAANEGANCTLTGPGSPGTYNNMACGETLTVNPTNSATYRLRCDSPDPTDETFKINVLPQIQET